MQKVAGMKEKRKKKDNPVHTKVHSRYNLRKVHSFAHTRTCFSPHPLVTLSTRSTLSFSLKLTQSKALCIFLFVSLLLRVTSPSEALMRCGNHYSFFSYLYFFRLALYCSRCWAHIPWPYITTHMFF